MFSKSTEYALRAVIFIAKNSTKNIKLSINAISEAIGSPKPFTAKILQKLSNNHAIVNSISGPKGGFYMTEEAKKKSLVEVLNILNDEIILEKCVLGLNKCSEINPCPLHGQYKHIKPKIIEMFYNKTLQELANEMDLNKLVLRN
jgi:Rrf2 family iron-sulfur cluster assembly transcriptional regulator